ncbi:MAG: S-layer homology domain-containing protein [Oscillibacter sp.]|nr:S-layer homology domain-containing protein [Oscillibacter sp.]
MKRRVLALLLCLSLTGVPALAADTDAPNTDEKPLISATDAADPDKTLLISPAPDAADEDDDQPFIDSENPDDPTITPLISAVGEPEESAVANPFEDVAENSPFLAGILYAVERGITNGTTAKTFSPYAICTHAQILTFLWRGWGSPKSTIANPFSDSIKTNAYYYQAALWAYEKGMTDAAFDPYAYCTRLQAVTYMWKLSGAPTVSQSGFPFADVSDDADARNAVAWAVEHGITNGTTTTTFSPDKRCTRAQIVTFIYRARDLITNP